jgi:SAM-dependent methyltransferase
MVRMVNDDQRLRAFNAVKRKFSRLPDVPGFTISLTYPSFFRIFEAFGVPGPNDRFMDIGCGKGYALVYAGLCGFTTAIGIDILPEAITRSQHVTEQCRVDPRWQNELHDVDFQLSVNDGASAPVPAGVTHVTVLIALPDDVLEQILARINESPDVTMMGVMLYHRQEYFVEEMKGLGWTNPRKSTIKLESSGEQHQFHVMQRAIVR